jgi:hypothetical protein
MNRQSGLRLAPGVTDSLSGVRLMSSKQSPQAVSSPSGRAPGGRFGKGNPGGPGNPFAKKTAMLRAYLINYVTEEDLQEVAEKLLDLAKSGIIPAVKILFAYVLGKPRAVAEEDLFELLSDELATPTTQAENAAIGARIASTAAAPVLHASPNPPCETAVYGEPRADHAEICAHTAQKPATPTPPASAPPKAGPDEEVSGPAGGEAPSTNRDSAKAEAAPGKKPPSTNGGKQRSHKAHKQAGSAWLDELRRAWGAQKKA